MSEIILENGGNSGVIKELEGIVRGDNPPTSQIALPYTGSANFWNRVYSNYYFKPTRGELTFSFSAQTSDGASVTMIAILYSLASTTYYVGTHEFGPSSSFNNATWTFPNLNNSQGYYLYFVKSDTNYLVMPTYVVI